jgi:hypothetical protein
MFMFSNEKNRLLDEVETLRGRVAVLESDVRDIKLKYWANEKLYAKKSIYGLKLDGTPKAKPGRKPSK